MLIEFTTVIAAGGIGVLIGILFHSLFSRADLAEVSKTLRFVELEYTQSLRHIKELEALGAWKSEEIRRLKSELANRSIDETF